MDNVDIMDTIDESKPKRELLVILVLSIVVFFLASRYDLLERIVESTRQYEDWQIDELLVLSLFLTFASAVFSFRRRKDVWNSHLQLIKRNEEIHAASNEIKLLRGIIPICSSCKKIRDDSGFWHQVESYVHDHSEAEFSHALCPDCVKKLYPEFTPEELAECCN